LQHPTLWQGPEFDAVLSFSICLDELETVHDGRVCRLAGRNLVNPVHVLYVDGCLVPEHTSPGVSADIISIPG